jgi:hypothetical protein
MSPSLKRGTSVIEILSDHLSGVSGETGYDDIGRVPRSCI